VPDPVLADRLDHAAGPVGDGIHGQKLGLHVGRKARMRRGADIDGARPRAVHVEADPVGPFLDRRTCLLQLDQNGLERGGHGARDLYPSAGRRCGDEIRASLDAVGHHPVASAMEPLDTLHVDDVRAVTLDRSTHGDQTLGEIDDLRFPGAVFEHGGSLGECRRHHQVLGPADGGDVHQNPGPLEAAATARTHVTVDDLDGGTHRREALQMLVDGPGTDGTATRQRHLRLAMARERRTEHAERRAHRLDR
jgi:hypothetical protein